MKNVKYDVTYEDKAGRLELFIRWFWSIPCYIVLFILAIISFFAMGFQFLHILLLGKKNKMLYDLTLMYMKYHVKWMSYFYMLTDERNPIMPEN